MENPTARMRSRPAARRGGCPPGNVPILALAAVAGLSFAAAGQTSRPAEGPSVALTDAGLLDVHARDTEITAVLEMLSYQLRTNIVTSTSVKGRISVNLYAVSLPQALDAVLTPNKYAYRQLGNTVFVGTLDEIAAPLPPQTQIFKLRYASVAEALTAVQAVLGKDGTATAGGAATSGTQAAANEKEFKAAGEDYLIVTAPPDRLQTVARVLREIDARPRQALIEATILRATLNEDNQFGIDFTMLGGVDFQNVGSISNATQDLQTGVLPANDLQSTTFNVGTTLLPNQFNTGFRFGLIKDSIAFFIRALEEVTDVIVVANPKIIALNKQEAEVIVGRRDGYLTTTVTQTAAIQTVEFLETGTQVKLRPYINEDGTVRLSVHPKDSNGGLTAANLPFEETTEARAEILLEDGHTVLIGGLFRERNSNSRGQVPALGNIPGLGLLFQSRLETTVREEVIILLTVHVLKETPQEQAQYAALLDDVERVRVGSRRGILGTGRERLSQAFYQEALNQLEQGRRNQALLNLRMALHNNPKHLAAFKLTERLESERMWDDEGTSMRTFLLDLIRREGAPTGAALAPDFGRPAPKIPADQAEGGADNQAEDP